MKGNRIYLRALEPDDYKTSIKWRQDEEIWNMCVGPRYIVSSEYEKKWVLDTIFSKDKIVLAICLNGSDKYIGNIKLHEIDEINRTANISIMLGDKTEWNKGFAFEAEMLMLRYAFMEKNLNRIGVNILADNNSSIGLHKKCGYVREGVLRDAIYKNGKFKDLVVMGLLKRDFIPIYEKYKIL